MAEELERPRDRAPRVRAELDRFLQATLDGG